MGVSDDSGEGRRSEDLQGFVGGGGGKGYGSGRDGSGSHCRGRTDGGKSDVMGGMTGERITSLHAGDGRRWANMGW